MANQPKQHRFAVAEREAGSAASMTHPNGYAHGFKDGKRGFDLACHFDRQPEFCRGYLDGHAAAAK